MDEPLMIDYSKSDAYYSCPRSYQLKYIKNLTAINGSTALRFGSAFHAALDGYYNVVKDLGWVEAINSGKAVKEALLAAAKDWGKQSEGFEFYPDYRTLGNLSTVFMKYLDHFYADEGVLEIRHTERAFKLLMFPTAKEAKVYPNIRPFYFTGKIDQENTVSGMDWITEFKTTGWSLDKLKSELVRSPQVIGYMYASRKCYDVRPEGVLVTIAYCTSRKKKDGEYGKLTIDFARYPQIYSEQDLIDWRRHFISLAGQIHWSETHNYYPPRFQSCFKYGRCEFLNLCEQGKPIEECILYGYKEKEPWDVTKTVSAERVVEAEENEEA